MVWLSCILLAWLTLLPPCVSAWQCHNSDVLGSKELASFMFGSIKVHNLTLCILSPTSPSDYRMDVLCQDNPYTQRIPRAFDGAVTWHQSVPLIMSTSPTSKGWMTKRNITLSYMFLIELPKTKTNAKTIEENVSHTLFTSTCSACKHKYWAELDEFAMICGHSRL